jgi:ParB-like chromosome segregation protein Spo0J
MAKRIPNLAEFDTLLPESLQGKVKLTDKVQWIKPDLVHPNPSNRDLFKEESQDYFKRLREDIQQRGILVPIVAKQDGTLLAGHNRLRIAKELSLKVVPVQYVQSDLTAEQEQEFIIKDNLYRRHLSQEDRIELYKKLFPSFEETFLEANTKTSVGRIKKDTSRLTMKTIAEKTGQKLSAVKMQITRARQASSEENGTVNNGHNVTKKIEAKKNGHNVTISNYEEQYKSIIISLKEIDELLKQEQIGEVKKRVKKLLHSVTNAKKR